MLNRFRFIRSPRPALAGLAALAFAAIFAAGCDTPPEPVKVRYVSSTYAVDTTPYIYGNPSPYGYATPWGQADAETMGYLGAEVFSPRQGLICERSRHACYGASGAIDDAETARYLGPREQWQRQKLYPATQAFVVP